jgi:hypothetical protein
VVDNSTGFHVLLPYAYAARLTEEAQRQRLQAAMQTRWYITPPSHPLPIVALYGADNEGMTSAGVAESSAEAAEGNGYNPRQSIQDPISAPHGTADGTGNGGMSSKGASRWSFGHTSSRGPAGVGEDYCPSLAGFVPDIVGNGQCWSVRYDQAAQILTHYYTGVQVRDANNADANSNLVTPRYRWNPLALDLAYAGCLTSPPTVRLDMQNSGVDSWDLDNVRLFYSVLFLDSAQAAQDAAAAQIANAALAADPANITAPGGTTYAVFQLRADRFTHGAGRYRILFDVQINSQNFADLAAAETPAKSWPTLERVLTLSSCQIGLVYLSPVQGDATATTLSQ